MIKKADNGKESQTNTDIEGSILKSNEASIVMEQKD